jgi:hypothetical protein
VDGQWWQNQTSLQYSTGFVFAFAPRMSGRLRRGTTRSPSPLNQPRGKGKDDLRGIRKDVRKCAGFLQSFLQSDRQLKGKGSP